MEQTITLEQLGVQLGIPYETVRMRAVRAFGGSWAKTTELNDEQIQVLSAGRSGKTKKTKNRPLTNTQTDGIARPSIARAKRVDWSGILSKSFDLVCISIVVGHAGLIWYDVANLWSVPGIIAGLISFLVVLACVIAAHNGKKQSTSAIATFLVFCLDVAAYWVHYPTFTKYATASPATTQGICILICAFSFGAFLLFRNSKIEIEW